ncbi:MAG: DNA-directed RNA polymerase subunit omega [Clostridia bacterium]|nr:DNA-directed RNA polymerase subunit omega [Clostridia bacterium]
MIKPSIQELTKGKINRYELVLATAKGAKLVTDEYCRQRGDGERLIARKETDKPLVHFIDKDYRDKKAVTIAIDRILDGEYAVTRDGDEV